MTDLKKVRIYSSLMGAAIASGVIFTASYFNTLCRDINYSIRPELNNLTEYFQVKDEFRRLSIAEELSRNPNLEASRKKYFSDLAVEMTRIEQTYREEIKAYEERQKIHKKIVFSGLAAMISFVGAVIFERRRKNPDESPQP